MAVSLAIKAGRLTAPAVVWVGEPPQPKIADVVAADEQWSRNTDPVRQANANMQPSAVRVPVPVLVAPLPTPPTIDRPPAEGELEDPATATERLKSAQADLAEIKRDKARGELVLASEVEARLVEVFAACKQRLLAIPSRARQALPHLSNADGLELEGLIREACEDLVSG